MPFTTQGICGHLGHKILQFQCCWEPVGKWVELPKSFNIFMLFLGTLDLILCSHSILGTRETLWGIQGPLSWRHSTGHLFSVAPVTPWGLKEICIPCYHTICFGFLCRLQVSLTFHLYHHPCPKKRVKRKWGAVALLWAHTTKQASFHIYFSHYSTWNIHNLWVGVGCGGNRGFLWIT